MLTALAASGMPWAEFAFLGFPPNKMAARRTFYRRAGALGLPFVVFEAPHRLLASLEDAAEALGERPLVLGRELTKLHEEFIRTTTTAAVGLIGASKVIGEFTLLFGAPLVTDEAREPLPDDSVWAELGRLTDAGLSRRDAVAELATREGRSSRDIYAAAERGKRLAAAD